MIKLMENEKINNIFLYLILFTLLYFGRDTLVLNSWIGIIPASIIQVFILLILSGNILIRIKQKKINLVYIKTRFFWCITVLLIIMLSMIINNAYTLMYFSISFAILNAFVLSMYFNYDDFMYKFTNIMLFLIIFSFVSTYFLGIFIEAPTFKNIADFEFYNYVFCFDPTLEGYTRIFSIFREPGVYQIFLLIPLYFFLFQKRSNLLKSDYFKIIVLVLGLISTYSVTGWIAFIVLFVAWMIKIANYKKIMNFLKSNKKLSIGIVLLIIIFFILLFNFVYNNKSIYWMLYSMISKIKNIGTNDARVEAILYNIIMFIKSPFFGEDINVILGGVPHNTSSFLLMYSIFGIIGGIIFTLLYMKYCEIKFDGLKNSILSILITIIFFLLLNCENITTNIFLYAFPIIYYFSSDSKYVITNYENVKEKENENIVVY